MEWQVRRGAPGGVVTGSVVGAVLEGEEFACAFCKGTGVVAKTHSQCPVCRGRRSIKITHPAMGCAYCRGKGEVPVRSGITCIVCLGQGVVSVSEPLKTCPACRGRGAAGGDHLPCTSCRGKGVIAVRGG